MSKFDSIMETKPVSSILKLGKLRHKSLKGTLMQIWKTAYCFMFRLKQYPENFAFLILETLELFACKVWKFAKK